MTLGGTLSPGYRVEGRGLDAGPGTAAELLVNRGGCVRVGTESEVLRRKKG